VRGRAQWAHSRNNCVANEARLGRPWAHVSTIFVVLIIQIVVKVRSTAFYVTRTSFSPSSLMMMMLG
jgi:hypothetical protein